MRVIVRRKRRSESWRSAFTSTTERYNIHHHHLLKNAQLPIRNVMPAVPSEEDTDQRWRVGLVVAPIVGVVPVVAGMSEQERIVAPSKLNCS